LLQDVTDNSNASSTRLIQLCFMVVFIVYRFCKNTKKNRFIVFFMYATTI